MESSPFFPSINRLPMLRWRKTRSCLSAPSAAMKSSSPGASVFGANPADAITRRCLAPLPFLMVVALSLILLYRATTPAMPFPPSSLRVDQAPTVVATVSSELPPGSSPPPQAGQDERLERVLREAATEDKTATTSSSRMSM
ncbi:hypothetical protein OPV22_006126 [Ensete ventricosum]|uniref:Uncharacterized protein n=1 Tax=Ensete ventricosum TaxID=4639 RepID=A0AAV8RED6_ENSVE|nr:hypothetical protein OPV22_006126 [Ensete ventricosum]